MQLFLRKNSFLERERRFLLTSNELHHLVGSVENFGRALHVLAQHIEQIRMSRVSEQVIGLKLAEDQLVRRCLLDEFDESTGDQSSHFTELVAVGGTNCGSSGNQHAKKDGL